jgi:adenylylsulfate kinase-like enzyme
MRFVISLEVLQNQPMTENSGNIIWLYGLPGTGKSTLAAQIVAKWRSEGKTAVVLDGDDLRRGLSAELGYGDDERSENVRRAAEVASLLCRQGIHVVAALVTPLRKHRELVRNILRHCPHELRWIDVTPEICAARRAARDGAAAPPFEEVVFEIPLGDD